MFSFSRKRNDFKLGYKMKYLINYIYFFSVCEDITNLNYVTLLKWFTGQPTDSEWHSDQNNCLWKAFAVTHSPRQPFKALWEHWVMHFHNMSWGKWVANIIIPSLPKGTTMLSKDAVSVWDILSLQNTSLCWLLEFYPHVSTFSHQRFEERYLVSKNPRYFILRLVF